MVLDKLQPQWLDKHIRYHILFIGMMTGYKKCGIDKTHNVSTTTFLRGSPRKVGHNTAPFMHNVPIYTKLIRIPPKQCEYTYSKHQHEANDTRKTNDNHGNKSFGEDT